MRIFWIVKNGKHTKTYLMLDNSNKVFIEIENNTNMVVYINITSYLWYLFNEGILYQKKFDPKFYFNENNVKFK